MKRIMTAFLAAAFIVAFGCSVIPKKFDSRVTMDVRRQIERQAESTLDFIEGKTDEIKDGAVKTAPSEKRSQTPQKYSLLQGVSEIVNPISVVHAASSKASSAEVLTIAEELRKRNPFVLEMKRNGIVGESNRGYLDMLSPHKFSDPGEKNDKQRLIAAENKDRKTLYEEVAKLNKEDNVSVSMVERIYAFERLKRAKTGDVFQLPGESVDFDAFKVSGIGVKLGAECVPKAWVTIK
jgi:uncharacterized protein YdbL (DUF1318 family)